MPGFIFKPQQNVQGTVDLFFPELGDYVPRVRVKEGNWFLFEVAEVVDLPKGFTVGDLIGMSVVFDVIGNPKQPGHLIAANVRWQQFMNIEGTIERVSGYTGEIFYEDRLGNPQRIFFPMKELRFQRTHELVDCQVVFDIEDGQAVNIRFVYWYEIFSDPSENGQSVIVSGTERCGDNVIDSLEPVTFESIGKPADQQRLQALNLSNAFRKKVEERIREWATARNQQKQAASKAARLARKADKAAQKA